MQARERVHVIGQRLQSKQRWRPFILTTRGCICIVREVCDYRMDQKRITFKSLSLMYIVGLFNQSIKTIFSCTRKMTISQISVPHVSRI